MLSASLNKTFPSFLPKYVPWLWSTVNRSKDDLFVFSFEKSYDALVFAFSHEKNQSFTGSCSEKNQRCTRLHSSIKKIKGCSLYFFIKRIKGSS